MVVSTGEGRSSSSPQHEFESAESKNTRQRVYVPSTQFENSLDQGENHNETHPGP